MDFGGRVTSGAGLGAFGWVTFGRLTTADLFGVVSAGGLFTVAVPDACNWYTLY